MSDSLDGNPQLRALLQVARSWGVSPSRFSGHEPVTRTVYTYDVMGRVVSSVTTTEPEWNDEDREMAFQLQEYEATLCSGCGESLKETSKRENEFEYVPASDPIRCHKCTRAGIESEKVHDSKLPQAQALHIPIVLRKRHIP